MKYLQLMWNKIQHIANGDIAPQKDIIFIIVMHLNKQTKFFNTNIEIFKHLVATENPTVCFFSRNQSQKKLTILKNDFLTRILILKRKVTIHLTE